MSKKVSAFFLQLMVGTAFFSFALYSYLEEQNKCTQLGMRLPKILKDIQELTQENARLHYQIIAFESPDHLLQLSGEPTYAHLKFPFFQDVLKAKTGLALQWPAEDESLSLPPAKTPSLIAVK